MEENNVQKDAVKQEDTNIMMISYVEWTHE